MNPDFTKMLIFKILRDTFITLAMKDSVTSMFSFEEYNDKIFEFILNVFNRVHFAMPNL